MRRSPQLQPHQWLMMLLAAVTVAFSGAVFGGTNNSDGQGEKIVVHIKVHQEDLQGAITGMRLATLMQSKGAEVTVFLTLRGVRIADSRVPQDMSFGRETEPTLEMAVDGFLTAGGTIAVCPACAYEIGLAQADLITPPDGAQGTVLITGPDEIGTLFMTADKVLDF
jgi:predicted peroxiredoxin